MGVSLGQGNECNGGQAAWTVKLTLLVGYSDNICCGHMQIESRETAAKSSIVVSAWEQDVWC